MFYLKLAFAFVALTLITIVGALSTSFGILIRRDKEIATYFCGLQEKLVKTVEREG